MRAVGFALPLGLLLALIGCQSVAPRLPTGLGAQAFWKDQTHRTSETQLISGKLSVRYQGKKESVAGHGRILAQMPDNLRLELRDPLGRLQYSLILSGKSLIAYYPSQKVAYMDSRAGYDYLRRFLGMDVTMSQLEDIFVGLVPVSKKELTSWEWDKSAGYYKGKTAADGHRTVTVLADGTSAAMRQMDVESPEETIHVLYSDFEPCCRKGSKLGQGSTAMLAQTVSIQLEKAQTSVEVEWDNIEPWRQPRQPDLFQANLPENVRKIALE